DNHFNDQIVTSRVALVNATNKYHKLVAQGLDDQAARFDDIIQKESRNLTEAQAGLNQLHGAYHPPPAIDPMVDKFVKQNLQSVFGPDFKAGTKAFIDDPIYYTTIRGIRGEVARTSTEFYNEMIRRKFALPEATAPKDWVKVAGDELKGYLVPKEYARVLNK